VWVVETEEVIYLLVLACIAVLWKPNPDAQEYGYYVLLGDQDEPTRGDGSTEFDLELTETNTNEQNALSQDEVNESKMDGDNAIA